MNKDTERSFLEDLASIIGKECWGISAGAGTGSVFELNFGEKILRDKPVNNPNLSEVQRKYDSSISFFVWCAWRLDSVDGVLFGSSDSDPQKMVDFLRQIIGRKILSVDSERPAFDLTLRFDGYTLKVFCDKTESSEDENYVFFHSSKIYSINPGGSITLEHR